MCSEPPTGHVFPPGAAYAALGSAEASTAECTQAPPKCRVETSTPAKPQAQAYAIRPVPNQRNPPKPTDTNPNPAQSNPTQSKLPLAALASSPKTSQCSPGCTKGTSSTRCHNATGRLWKALPAQASSSAAFRSPLSQHAHLPQCHKNRITCCLAPWEAHAFGLPHAKL